MPSGKILPSGPESRYDQVLRVALTLPEEFTKEDLTVACWVAYPEDFGFAASDGISRPHSNAVNVRVNGSVGLVARKLMDWVHPGVLMVTERGRKFFTRAPTTRKAKPIGECVWCGGMATTKDESGEDSCHDDRNERAARKARKQRETATAGKAVAEAAWEAGVTVLTVDGPKTRGEVDAAEASVKP